MNARDDRPHDKRKQVPQMTRHSRQQAKSHVPGLARGLTVMVLALGVALACAPAGFGHESRIGGASSKSDGAKSAAPAIAARTISLDENSDMQLTSRKGFTLNERGAATGTFKGTIYVHLKIVSSSHVTAEVNIYPSGGSSITGYGTAGYRKEGAIGRFSGSLSVQRGTGTYAHAHGSGLSFSGTIQRSNYAVTVHVSGTASY
jgi:hypothetical protein